MQYEKVYYKDVFTFPFVSIFMGMVFVFIIIFFGWLIQFFYYQAALTVQGAFTEEEKMYILFPSAYESTIFKSSMVTIANQTIPVLTIEVIGNKVVDGNIYTEAYLHLESGSFLPYHYYEVTLLGEKKNFWDYLISYGKEVMA